MTIEFIKEVIDMEQKSFSSKFSPYDVWQTLFVHYLQPVLLKLFNVEHIKKKTLSDIATNQHHLSKFYILILNLSDNIFMWEGLYLRRRKIVIRF